MKKLFILLSLLACLYGCTNTTNTPQSDQTYTGTSDPNDDANKDEWYTTFENYLGSQNMAYTSKSVLDGSSIGAKAGYRYTMDNGYIDVYHFEDGDDFDRIVNSKQITINGEDEDVFVFDHYVISGEHVDDDVFDIIKKMK